MVRDLVYKVGRAELGQERGQDIGEEHDALGHVWAYEVEGDCCSYSYFHDFFGVPHLLNNGAVTEVGDVDLAPDDPRFKRPAKADERPADMDYDHPDYWDYSDEDIQVYGYKIVTAHPVFGEVTSVLSFRNSSNGYYGGWMDRTGDVRTEGLQRITEDFTGD